MIQASDYHIYFQEERYTALIDHITDARYSSVFILVDEHTRTYCLPVFLSKIDSEFHYQIITIPSGEINKNLQTCTEVWNQLTTLKADRNSLLINIGGGMLTDLGGFVASTFKRGIRFVNIPTTLLGMVDASVGGKTGVDLDNLKNQIGMFSNPELIIIDYTFLKTLPTRELHAGMAEVIKYALTYDDNLWQSIKKHNQLDETDLKKWIYRSIEIKNEIVIKDPKEKSLRKILNFGHTIGHAIESHFLNRSDRKTLIHGEAIAIGLIMETYISHKQFGFPKEELETLKKVIHTLFSKEEILEEDHDDFLELMKHDKKNTQGQISFILLEQVEKFHIDCKVEKDLIIEALHFYNQ